MGEANEQAIYVHYSKSHDKLLCIITRAKTSLNQTVEKYLDPNTLDPGWGQVKKLCSTNAASELGGPFMKERKKKHACDSGVVYQLLDSGREMALKLRQLAEAGPVEPGPLRQLPSDTVDEEFGNGASESFAMFSLQM